MSRAIPPLSAAERAEFIRAARGYLRVRWRHQGRSRLGVDCAGLLIMAMRQIGREVVDAQGYGRVPYRGRLEAMLETNLGPMLPREGMQAGDVVLFRFRDGQPSHVGIAFDHPEGGWAMVHAFAVMRQVVEHRIDEWWFDKIAGVFRT